MSSEPEKKTEDNGKVTPTNADDSDDEHSYVSEPDEAQKRYAALRNHQIRFSDAIDPNAERVHQITSIDILLGRGRGFQNHTGNKRMRNIVENYKMRYHSLNRMDKRKMVQQVYDKVIEGGARFLKKLENEEAWVVVDLPIALQKVSHTMRCRKSIHKRLDELGLVPQGMGGPRPMSPNTNALISRLPGMGGPGAIAPPLAGAPHHLMGGIPRIVSAGTRDPLGVPSSLAMSEIPSAVGISPLTGMRSSLGALGGYRPHHHHHHHHHPPGLNSIADLEAQHVAAQNRYRSIAGMSAKTRMEYYEEMRKQQIIRETQMYSRMGDALLMNGTTPGMPPLGTAGGLLPAMHASLPPGAAAAIHHPTAVRHPTTVHRPTAAVPGPVHHPTAPHPTAIPGAVHQHPTAAADPGLVGGSKLPPPTATPPQSSLHAASAKVPTNPSVIETTTISE
ncbi:MAG: hypothetical protein SGBAC_011110 [Bacillariaceae sp.]